MKTRALRLLNMPILFCLILFGIGIQSSFFSNYPLLYLQPDVVLLAVIWCALRRPFTEGGVFTLLIANAAEIHSGAPRGLFLCTYMAVYLGLRGVSRVFQLSGLSSLVGLTLFTSVFWKLFSLLILHWIDRSSNQWRHTLALLLPGAVMEGIVATWAFKGLERFDWVTFKNPRSKQIQEEELLLDEEGL